jgi:hypothetical protein
MRANFDSSITIVWRTPAEDVRMPMQGKAETNASARPGQNPRAWEETNRGIK